MRLKIGNSGPRLNRRSILESSVSFDAFAHGGIPEARTYQAGDAQGVVVTGGFPLARQAVTQERRS